MEQEGKTIMSGERAAIFGQFIEQLSESEVGILEREDVYAVLLEVLEEFDVKGMETYLNIDPAFDEMYNERYPELAESDE